jgi:pyridoxamine 5'-phosphate oxidase
MGLLAKIAGVPGLLKGLHETELDPDPFAQFARWYACARRGCFLPSAMTLATATPDGSPSARMMLLKGHGPGGFVFYTNYESRKGGELDANPRAALILHWSELHRQVRVEGALARLTAAESAKYFHHRPRGSQIGAWASHQSRPAANREELEAKYRAYEGKYRGQEIPLPPYWGGFRLVPQSIEFWQGRIHRLHDRFVYTRDGDRWTVRRLCP